jgi:ABC-2 type transport system permease protein
VNKILSLALHELRLFFLTPVAYIVAFAFYTVNGILFWYVVNRANTPAESLDGNLMTHLTGGVVFWLCLFLLVPAISMRLLAFEAEKKRLAHLFSAPIRTREITLGKFAGGLSFYVLLWAPTALYFACLPRNALSDSGPVWTAFLGLFLIGAFALSIGLAASAASSNQLTSAIVCFFFLLGLLLLSLFEGLLNDGTAKEVLGSLNYVEHFIPFTEGVIDTRALVFFLGATLFFLATSNEIIDWRRDHYDS